MRKLFGAALVGVVLATASSAAMSRDALVPAYSYTIYADDAKTIVVGYAWDTCMESMGHVYVTSPELPTGRYDQQFMYYCSSFGPYLPD